MSRKFQFPSNGKVLSDLESFLKTLEELAFPFPSNGKVLSD